MTFYPVVIPTLNRYEHFKNCVESLAKNTLAGQTELVIGLDYPPSEKYVEGWKRITEYIPSISGFLKVTVLNTDVNLGAVKNSERLKDYVFSKYDAYIITEDDNFFSPLFLEYINSGLERYKNDESVFAICGYSYPVDWSTDKNSVLEKQFFSAWGYGIWKDRYYKYMSCTHDEFTKKFLMCRDIRKNKINMIHGIDFAFSNKEHLVFMDTYLSAYLQVYDKSVLMPVVSLSRNMGHDGSGIHSTKRSMVDYSNQQINVSNNFELSVDDSLKYRDTLDSFIEDIWSDDIRVNNVYSIARFKYFLLRLFGFKRIIGIRNILKGMRHGE